MEILAGNYSNYAEYEAFLCFKKKMDTDEEIARWELIRVWTKILERYARPGMEIPPVDFVREELIRKGVDAAVKAVVDEHWFVFTWMVRKEIEQKVRKGFDSFDLEYFLDDVRMAQNDPAILKELRKQIRDHVLFLKI